MIEKRDVWQDPLRRVAGDDTGLGRGIVNAATNHWYGPSSDVVRNLAGQRWTVPIIAELLLGARSFSGLRNAIPSISAKVLSARLKSLQVAGALSRRTGSEPGDRARYELTRWGYAAERFVLAIFCWDRARAMGWTNAWSPTALVLAMRARLDTARASEATIGLVIARQAFTLRTSRTGLAVSRDADLSRCDAVIAAVDLDVMIEALDPHTRPFSRSGHLQVTGNSGTGEQFLDLLRAS